MAGSSHIGTPEAATGTVSPGGQVWPVRMGVAPPLADGFTGRPETVPGLTAALVPGAVVVLANRQAAAGRAGPWGKTQLAVYAAESAWWSREVDLLAWVDATSRASVLSRFVEAAAAVGIDPAGTAEQVAARFTGWLAETARPWLVVLDDLRDAADLDQLWPSGPAGTVVITTGDEHTVAGQPHVQVVPLGAFSPREAMKYLMGRLSADTDQRHGAVGLVTELGCEPLALSQASAVIATTMLSCADYQHHFTQRREQLTAAASGERPGAAVVTSMLAAEHAERLVPGGATGHLLALAALLDGHPVPGPVFTTPAVCAFFAETGTGATGPDRAREAVQALERTGLLTINPTGTTPAIWLSGAVAAQARAAAPEPVVERAARAAADALVEIWPKDEPRPWLAAGLRACVARLQHTAGDLLWTEQGPHPVLHQAGHSIDAARLTGPAAGYWAQLAATSDRILGRDHPHTVTVGGHLADALLAAGQATDAAAWARWVAASHARRSGPSHPDTLAAQVGVGRALAAAGQPGPAVTVLGQAVAGYEHRHGPAHPATVHARDELAAACQADGRPAEAIELYQQTLADLEQAHGPGHRATIAARDNLAAACLANGRLKEAIACYKRALADREHALGPDDLDTIATRRTLATAYHTAGKIAAALELHEQVCADYEQALGTDHPHTLTARADLASAYYAAGRLTDAATLLRDTLARCEQALPPGHPLTHTLRHTLTSIAAG